MLWVKPAVLDSLHSISNQDSADPDDICTALHTRNTQYTRRLYASICTVASPGGHTPRGYIPTHSSLDTRLSTAVRSLYHTVFLSQPTGRPRTLHGATHRPALIRSASLVYSPRPTPHALLQQAHRGVALAQSTWHTHVPLEEVQLRSPASWAVAVMLRDGSERAPHTRKYIQVHGSLIWKRLPPRWSTLLACAQKSACRCMTARSHSG